MPRPDYKNLSVINVTWLQPNSTAPNEWRPIHRQVVAKVLDWALSYNSALTMTIEEPIVIDVVDGTVPPCFYRDDGTPYSRDEVPMSMKWIRWA